MSTVIEPKSATFAVLDVVAAILALMGLLPMAGGLPSIASPAIPFADAIWFMANLAGPALLLAAGLRLALRGITTLWYVSGYTLLLMAAGELRLWMTGFHRLAVGWFVMTSLHRDVASHPPALLAMGGGRGLVERPAVGHLVCRWHHGLRIGKCCPVTDSVCHPDRRRCHGSSRRPAASPASEAVASLRSTSP